jgi:hypothetical protein
MGRPYAQGGNSGTSAWGLYIAAGLAASVAFAANVLDVVLGFGDTALSQYGSRTAVEWFALFQQSGFKGLYVLGLLNIVYQIAMILVFVGLFAAHRRTLPLPAGLAMAASFVATAIYVANNAALPMFVLSGKYAAAANDAERAVIAAAGEAVLARGEDFTPGSFVGLFLGGIAAIVMSFVMLRGGVFGAVTAWIGIAAFTCLSIFTIWATFIPAGYAIAFYGFGMTGGLLALAWFAGVALRFFAIARSGTRSR